MQLIPDCGGTGPAEMSAVRSRAHYLPVFLLIFWTAAEAFSGQIVPVSSECLQVLDKLSGWGVPKTISSTYQGDGDVFVGLGGKDLQTVFEAADVHPVHTENVDRFLNRGRQGKGNPQIQLVAQGLDESDERQDLLICVSGRGCHLDEIGAGISSDYKHPRIREIPFRNAHSLNDIEFFEGFLSDGFQPQFSQKVSTIFLDGHKIAHPDNLVERLATPTGDLLHETTHYVDKRFFFRYLDAEMKLRRHGVPSPHPILSSFGRRPAGPGLTDWWNKNKRVGENGGSPDSDYRFAKAHNVPQMYALASELREAWSESNAYAVSAYVAEKTVKGATREEAQSVFESLGYQEVFGDTNGIVFRKIKVREPELSAALNERLPMEGDLSFFSFGPSLTAMMQETIDAAARIPD